MARSEARIQVTIWSDPDFCALPPGAQRTFMFLLSQADLAHDGVIALRERRWSRSARGLTAEQLLTDLAELHEARFVVMDLDAEELLVRSFIRRDRVYRQPNVLRAAADHLAVVTSETIRQALADELARIADESMPDGSVPILAEMRAALPNPSGKGSRNPSRNPQMISATHAGNPPGEPSTEPGNPSAEPVDNGASEPVDNFDADEVDSDAETKPNDWSDVFAGNKGSGNPSRKGSANPSGNPTAGTPGERGVVTAVTTSFPVPRSSFPGSPIPDPLPLASLASAPEPTATKRRRERAEADEAFEQFWRTYPRREAKATARKAWDRAIKRTDLGAILVAAQRYRDQPGRDPKFTAHPATWLNGDRWADEPPPPGRASTGSHRPYMNPDNPEDVYGGAL